MAKTSSPVLRVKEVRKGLNISVPELEKLSGLSRRTIENVEKSGDCLTSTALKIAAGLGVTVNDLFTMSE